MKCAKCGRDLAPGAKFCGVCGEIVRETVSDRYEGSGRSGGSYETDRDSGGSTGGRTLRRVISSGVSRMPQGIALGVDEKIVKQYRIGRYTFRQGAIEVIVTNKRVIRYEESRWFGMQNNQIDEINVDAVHGVSTTMKRSVSILGMIFALALLIIGISMLSVRGYSYMYGGGTTVYGIICLALCVLIVMKSFKPTLLFFLHGAIGGEALGTVVNDRGRMFGKNNSGIIFQFKPTAETTEMLKEIGACVYDLKTLGDAAIPKWS